MSNGLPDEYQYEVVEALSYDSSGRVTGLIRQSRVFTQQRIDRGEPVVWGSGQYDRFTGESPLYVDLSGGGRALRARPLLSLAADRYELAVGEEAVLTGVPEGEIKFTGPISGSQTSTGTGSDEIGWEVPGVYTVSVDTFPYMPASLVITVK